MSALKALNQASPITVAALQSHNAEDIPVSRLLATITNGTRKNSKPSTFSTNRINIQRVLNYLKVTFLSGAPGMASTVS